MNKYFDDKVIWITGHHLESEKHWLKNSRKAPLLRLYFPQGRKNNFIMLPEK